jgi:aspartate aminotransferase
MNGMEPRFSDMAERLEGSEILRLANKVRGMISEGKRIANYTVGDFMPGEFRIPDSLEEAILRNYKAGLTNYPPSMGVPELKKAACAWLEHFYGLSYKPEETLIASGARPLIFLTYAAIVNPGEKAVFPVPSWNNNHYCKLLGLQAVPVQVKPEDNFLPTADTLRPHLKDARLLTLTSPSNPTGTCFSREALQGICELLLEENTRRVSVGEKPCYLLYDQMYSMLTFDREHLIPTQLLPELRPWMILSDGASKWLAGTGIRVGWGYGPKDLMEVMGNMLAHVGAWAPKPEQLGVAEIIADPKKTQNAIKPLKHALHHRLVQIYNEIQSWVKEGFPVQIIEPQGALYLSLRLDIVGQVTPSGKRLLTNADIADYILEEGRVALVPFQAFGVKEDNGWFRLSVGGVASEDIMPSMANLKQTLEAWKK